MAFVFSPLAFTPARCGPARRQLSPLFSLFDDAARELQQPRRVAKQITPTFNPRFDVTEDKESYILEGEVPGFQERDLSIEWNDNVLAIHGRQEQAKNSGKQSEVANSSAETTLTGENASSETGSAKSHQPTVEDEDEEVDEKPSTPSDNRGVQRTAAASTSSTPAATTPEIQHWVSERRTGQFIRKFSFPSQAVDYDGIKASLQFGILKIVIPKAAPPASRRINIE